MEWGVVQYPGLISPVGDPEVWVEPVFFDGWQNPSTELMPNYDPRFIFGDIANMPYFMFQAELSTLFEALWLPGLGQQNQDTLMPTYDPRFLYGDIANMPYLWLQLHANIHFGPNASGDFPDPGSFDITVQSGEFEIRGPL